MTQEKNNIVVEKIFKVIGEIDRKTVKLDAVKFLDVFMDISLSICHEFGDFKKLDDKEVADVLEFLDQYELPYQLQKKFGLMDKGTSVLESVKQQGTFSAKLFGLKIGSKTSYYKNKNDLVDLLSNSRLRNLKISHIEHNLEEQEIVFVARTED